MKFTDRPVGPGATAAASTPTSARRPPRSSPTSRSPRSSGRRSRPSPASQPPATVLFVDGVRRVDAQVWVDEGVGTVAPGLCASYAAGIVCCCERDGAHLAAFEVRRSLVTAARDAEKIVTWAGTYDVVARGRSRAGAARPPSCCRRHCRSTWPRSRTKVAASGPRARRAAATTCSCSTGSCEGRAPAAAGDRVRQEPRHAATSTARLGAVVGGSRRGSAPRSSASGGPSPCSAGTCGCPAGSSGAVVGGRAGRVRRRPHGRRPRSRSADLAQVTLVRYASAEYKDARAPQNLYPIAGLERGAPAASRRARPALPRAAGRGRLNRAPSSVAATHRSSTASWQLASSSACSTASGSARSPGARCAAPRDRARSRRRTARGLPGRGRRSPAATPGTRPRARRTATVVAPYPSRLMTPPSSTAHASTAGTCRACWRTVGTSWIDAQASTV